MYLLLFCPFFYIYLVVFVFMISFCFALRSPSVVRAPPTEMPASTPARDADDTIRPRSASTSLSSLSSLDVSRPSLPPQTPNSAASSTIDATADDLARRLKAVISQNTYLEQQQRDTQAKLASKLTALQEAQKHQDELRRQLTELQGFLKGRKQKVSNEKTHTDYSPKMCMQNA